MKKSLLFFSLFLASVNVFSEDIELYLVDSNLQEESKPQVLLMVDTSGSMAFTESIKTPYDPNREYEYLGQFSNRADPYLYYVIGSDDELPAVDEVNEKRRMLASVNNCSVAKASLATVGFYTGRIRQYKFSANIGSWQELNEVSSDATANGSTATIFDCEDDIKLDLENIAAGREVQYDQNVKDNVTIEGYPIDGAGSNSNPIYYDADIDSSNATWTGRTVTLYTDKYLRWEQGLNYRNPTSPIGFINKTRIDIARDTLTNLVNSIPSVKFGLEVYNVNARLNSGDDLGNGGRIAFGIKDIVGDDQDELIDIFENQLHASGSTPLCESYYEAYRYFSGSSVLYGDDDVSVTVNRNTDNESFHDANSPRRDRSIENEGTYISPYGGCSNKVFVIMITDGIPQWDEAADEAIIALQSSSMASVTEAEQVSASPVDENYLPVLASVMKNYDINSNLDGKQTAQLYTVGFSSGADSAVPVLQAAASNGGGAYYNASDPTKLGSKLQEALTSILSVSTSFTAPSLATNSFDRTETLNSVYYAMFQPLDGARWSGNLKKLKLVDGELKDSTGAIAVDEDGSILEDAQTYWSSSTDGNEVNEGGVVEMFSGRTTSRNVYSDISSTTELPPLTYSNLQTHLTTEAAVNTLLNVTTREEAEEYLNWGLGIDTAASTTTLIKHRDDLFGDPLHSKPVAINYGGTADNQDVRILVGTNAGVLHMFKDNDTSVEETWAFMPKEFLPNIKTLKENEITSSKLYGIDGRITVHIDNDDGTIDSSETSNDKVWAFFGLRRGGSSYYGLDITDFETPKLLWKIEATDSGFSRLGQTWSQPQVVYSKLNIVDGVPKPVLVFGAGYSIAKDVTGPNNGNDTVGLGIYMVDAETGVLLWSATPDVESDINTQFTGFTDSIPSKIGTLDSDGDGLVDRLYTGDTGGNIFRIDMPGSDPFDDDTPWTAFKLAELGGASEIEKTNTNDRRFFNEPAIVRTFFTERIQSSTDASTFFSQETPYDAILLGSGDRTSPTYTDTEDEFFMVQDKNVRTQSFDNDSSTTSNDTPTLITYTDLENFTSNLTDEDAIADRMQSLSTQSGWRFKFPNSGEKSTASAIVVDGVAYFTSFTPGVESTNVCELVEGAGRLYAIDMYSGVNRYTWREQITMVGMPDTPVLASFSDDEEDASSTDPDADPVPAGIQEANLTLFTGGAPININTSLTTSRSYQYVSEQP